jgi:hypothetical protein
MKTPDWFIAAPRLVRASLALLGLMLLGVTPQALRAQECEEVMALITGPDKDSEFYYGRGITTSRVLQLARSQSQALARAELAMKASVEVTSLVEAAMEAMGEVDPAIGVVFRQGDVQIAQARLTGATINDSAVCMMGAEYQFVTVLQIAKENIIEKMEEIVEEAETELNNSIRNGDAEYSRTQTDAVLSRVHDMLDAQRRPGGQV